MKSLIKNKLIILSIIFFCGISSANTAKAQIFPINPGDSVNVFGPFQDMIVAGQLLKVRTKLLRHFGFTCQFEIEITNQGSKSIASKTGLVSGNSGTLYEVTSVNLNLKPNFYVVYKLEIRECLKRKIKDPLISCMACNPRIGFYNPSAK